MLLMVLTVMIPLARGVVLEGSVASRRDRHSGPVYLSVATRIYRRLPFATTTCIYCNVVQTSFVYCSRPCYSTLHTLGRPRGQGKLMVYVLS